MVDNVTGNAAEFTENHFAQIYGGVEVQFGSRTVTLATALAMEAAFCLTDDPKRTDPAGRLGYLAGKVAEAGELLPEHAYLLQKPDPQISS